MIVAKVRKDSSLSYPFLCTHPHIEICCFAACGWRAGRVLINDKPAKASATVKPGDKITIQFGTKDVNVEVLSISETVKKEEAAELYRYI